MREGRDAAALERCAQEMQAGRAVEVVGDVVLARPDELHRRAGQGLGDGDGLADEVDVEPAAEAAADELRMHAHAGGRNASHLRGDLLRPRRELGARPDVDAARRDERDTVRRLERHVREHLRRVARLDRLAARERRGDVTGLLHEGTRAVLRLLEPCVDSGGVERGAGTLVPLDIDIGERGARGPIVVRRRC